MLMLDKTARNYVFASLGFGMLLFTQPEIFTGGTIASTAPTSEPTTVAKAAKPLPASSSSMVVLQSDARGHFLTDVSAVNQFIRVLVDTGASMVALSHDDAQKIGLSARNAIGFSNVSTANGMVRVAMVRIPELRLQGLRVHDVEAAIMPPGALSHSLLGMSFLKRLASFEMRGKTLVLKQ